MPNAHKHTGNCRCIKPRPQPPKAESRYFYHACKSELTPDAVMRSLRAIEDVAEGYDISNINLELWVKPGWYMIGVPFNQSVDELRAHSAQMFADGWSRRA